MDYYGKKERLLAEIRSKYGISLTVADDTDEDAVLRALAEIAGERPDQVLPGEDELLRFLEGKQSESKAVQTSDALEKAFRNAPAALLLICLGAPADDDVARILVGLCGNDAILLKKSPKELILMVPAAEMDTDQELREMATAIADTLAGDAMMKATIVVDRIINEMGQMPKSFENIRNAREIGLRLNPEERVVSFHQLGLGKMLHTLSAEEREEFLTDNLGTFRFAGLEPDMQETIHTFFDADLSVTETAKRLFIHRNTLIYRIDKLYRMTGLDLRKFGDAVIAKIALQLEQLER